MIEDFVHIAHIDVLNNGCSKHSFQPELHTQHVCRKTSKHLNALPAVSAYKSCALTVSFSGSTWPHTWMAWKTCLGMAHSGSLNMLYNGYFYFFVIIDVNVFLSWGCHLWVAPGLLTVWLAVAIMPGVATQPSDPEGLLWYYNTQNALLSFHLEELHFYTAKLLFL